MASSLFGNTVMDEKLKCLSGKALWWSVKWSIIGLLSSYTAGFSPWETRMRIDREKRVCIEWVSVLMVGWGYILICDDVYADGLLCKHKKPAVFRTAGEWSGSVCSACVSDMTLWSLFLFFFFPALGSGHQQRKETRKRQTRSSLTSLWHGPNSTTQKYLRKLKKNCTNVCSSWCVRSCSRDVFSCCFVKYFFFKQYLFFFF